MINRNGDITRRCERCGTEITKPGLHARCMICPRVCSKCGIEKPITEFYLERDHKGNEKRRANCKECKPTLPRRFCPHCGRKHFTGKACLKCTAIFIATRKIARRMQRRFKRRLRDKLENSTLSEFGGTEWKTTLTKISYQPHRESDPWITKFNTIIKGHACRCKADGECERRRKRKATGVMTWIQRLRICAQPKDKLRQDAWMKTMETKARNWRRKERKVVVHVKGERQTVTLTIAKAGVQMRFDW